MLGTRLSELGGGRRPQVDIAKLKNLGGTNQNVGVGRASSNPSPDSFERGNSQRLFDKKSRARFKSAKDDREQNQQANRTFDRRGARSARLLSVQ